MFKAVVLLVGICHIGAVNGCEGLTLLAYWNTSRNSGRLWAPFLVFCGSLYKDHITMRSSWAKVPTTSSMAAS